LFPKSIWENPLALPPLRCPCGCGLGLAQCVATDSTCPIREENIERIKKMVRSAEQQ
jgi:hypothetical protein